MRLHISSRQEDVKTSLLYLGQQPKSTLALGSSMASAGQVQSTNSSQLIPQEPGTQEEDEQPMGSKLGLHPACPPCSPCPCQLLRPQCPLPSLAQARRWHRPALPTKFGIALALGHPRAGGVEQAGAFATFRTPGTHATGRFWHSSFMSRQEGSAKICCPYSLLATCKWTLILITCIQHPWLSNKYSEGASAAEADGHHTHLPLGSELLQDLLFAAHRR